MRTLTTIIAMLLAAPAFAQNDAQAPVNPGPAEKQNLAPAWIKPGVRISYVGGDSASSSNPNAKVLRQTAVGGTIEGPDGKQYKVTAGMPTVGGVGYSHYDIVAVDGDVVLMQTEMHIFLDGVERGRKVLSGGQGVLANAIDGGTLWWPVDALRQQRVQLEGEHKIFPVQYALGRQVYDAVAMQIVRKQPQTYISSVYDKRSGVMLMSVSTTQGEAMKTLFKVEGKQVTLGDPAQYTNRSFMRFMGTRQRNLPWARGTMPQWVAQAKTLHYRGESIVRIEGVPFVPRLPLEVTYTQQSAGDNWAMYDVKIVQHGADRNFPPAITNNTLACGPATLGGVWIDPATVRGLQTPMLVDRDPITGDTLTLQHVGPAPGGDGQVAVIVHDTAHVDQQFTYDLASGVLTHYRYHNAVLNQEMYIALVRQ